MESNDQFARRMRAKRAGITVAAQKKIDFAAALGGKPTFPDPDAPNLDDARALMKRVYQGDSTEQEAWIGRGLEDLNCPRRKHTRRRDGLPGENDETFEHARIRLTDALKDMFPQLTVRDYDPEDPGPTSMTFQTAAGPLDVDTAEYGELVNMAEAMSVPLFTDAGWPTTKGELRHILLVAAKSRERITGPREVAPGITEEPVAFVKFGEVEGEEAIDYDPVDVLSLIGVAEHVPTKFGEVVESAREEEQAPEPAPEPAKKPWWKIW